MASNHSSILIAGKLTCLKPEPNLICIMVGKNQNFPGKKILMDALLDFHVLFLQSQNYSDTNLSAI